MLFGSNTPFVLVRLKDKKYFWLYQYLEFRMVTVDFQNKKMIPQHDDNFENLDPTGYWQTVIEEYVMEISKQAGYV